MPTGPLFRPILCKEALFPGALRHWVSLHGFGHVDIGSPCTEFDLGVPYWLGQFVSRSVRADIIPQRFGPPASVWSDFPKRPRVQNSGRPGSQEVLLRVDPGDGSEIWARSPKISGRFWSCRAWTWTRSVGTAWRGAAETYAGTSPDRLARDLRLKLRCKKWCRWHRFSTEPGWTDPGMPPPADVEPSSPTTTGGPHRVGPGHTQWRPSETRTAPSPVTGMR